MSALNLVPATDAHYAWMLGEADAPDDRRLPPGGIDTPAILRWLRRTLPKLGGYGAWLMVADGEIVGLCGYKWPPTTEGEVEIGYEVAPERRRRGYAREASRLLLAAARRDPRVRALVAETAVGNAASQRVLMASGYFQAGRGYDDDEGETVRWRLELSDSARAELPPGRLAERLDTLYATENGRMVRTNSWERQPAPRFHLMVTASGPMTRCRGDVPTELARELDRIAAGERWDLDAEGPSQQLGRYVAALEATAPVETIRSGPAFALLHAAMPIGPALEVGPGNADLLRDGLSAWRGDIPHCQPFLAVAQGGQAVSLCASVRISPTVHCAGVETLPEHRRRGHALVAVAAWAAAVQALGATAFYSTTWDNAGSRRVAARLGFQHVATDLSLG